jgi:hypothetical protein
MEEPEPEVQEAAQEASVATRMALIRPVSDGLPAPPPPLSPEQQPCPTCGTPGASMPVSFVYALGRIEPRFPRLSVEKEFAQATGRRKPPTSPTGRHCDECLNRTVTW